MDDDNDDLRPVPIRSAIFMTIVLVVAAWLASLWLVAEIASRVGEGTP